MKSSRNKTLTISDEERVSLQQQILTDTHDTDFNNVIINADFFEVIDTLPDGIADLVIVDPPYNLTKNYNGNIFSAISDDKYADYTRSWFERVAKKLKTNGTMYVCCDWRCSNIIYNVLAERMCIINRITWQRDKGRGAKSNYKNNMEDIWFAVNNPKQYTFNIDSIKQRRKVIAPYRIDGVAKDWNEQGGYRDTYPSNIWTDLTVPFWSMSENTEHPTQKPEKLIARLILASSNEGDVVLDPFAGSGTTAAVAEKLGRHYICIERENEYCLYMAKRVEMAKTDKTIQGYRNGIFLDKNANQ